MCTRARASRVRISHTANIFFAPDTCVGAVFAIRQGPGPGRGWPSLSSTPAVAADNTPLPRFGGCFSFATAGVEGVVVVVIVAEIADAGVGASVAAIVRDDGDNCNDCAMGGGGRCQRQCQSRRRHH